MALKLRNQTPLGERQYYVLREIERLLEKPIREELFARIAQLPPIELDPPPSEILRQEREKR